jgi:hypothetical protein
VDPPRDVHVGRVDAGEVVHERVAEVGVDAAAARGLVALRPAPAATAHIRRLRGRVAARRRGCEATTLRRVLVSIRSMDEYPR